MKYLIEKNITMGIYQIRNLVNGKKYVYENFEWTVLSKEYNNIFNCVKNLERIS
jgi:hypothetical protein